jgi:uncharacterized protein YndB with AHSA1/START domain
LKSSEPPGSSTTPSSDTNSVTTILPTCASLSFFGPAPSADLDWKGEYREVVETERLVFTLSDQPGEESYELIIVVLTDLGDGRSTFFDRIAERLELVD